MSSHLRRLHLLLQSRASPGIIPQPWLVLECDWWEGVDWLAITGALTLVPDAGIIVDLKFSLKCLKMKFWGFFFPYSQLWKEVFQRRKFPLFGNVRCLLWCVMTGASLLNGCSITFGKMRMEKYNLCRSVPWRNETRGDVLLWESNYHEGGNFTSSIRTRLSWRIM